MRIVLDTHLVLSDLTEAQERLWKGRTTHRNPDFAAALRDGRYTGPTKANPAGIPERLALWEDTPDGLALPRGMLREVMRSNLGTPLTDNRICPPWNQTPNPINLRDYQAPAVRDAMTAGQGFVISPTGSGKTVMAMALMALLQTPAIMLVNTTVLLDQTIRQVKKFLGIQAGRIGDGTFDLRDITVSTIQTLAVLDPVLMRDVTSRFGLVILDEADLGSARTFVAAVSAFPAKYRFGLTATPSRTDGLIQIIFDVIGPVVHRVPVNILIDSGAIVPAAVVPIQTGFAPREIPMQTMTPAQEGRLRRMGRQPRPSIDHNGLINMLCADSERNQTIVDTVRRLHESKSVVLTERVEHAAKLAASFRAVGLTASALTGETPKKERIEILDRLAAGTLAVLVSIPSLVGRGFDLPTIDTVFLVVPNGNPGKTTQILGRVLRPSPGKARGRIVDFVDGGVPLLRKYAMDRAAVYAKFQGQGGALPLGRTA